MSFNVGENVGPYRIIEQLGQGGMATVYKAYHASLDRYVALKVLHTAFREDPNFEARFQREARLVAKLEHPNIVPIYDYAEHEGRPFLVMKFIEGETLKARMLRGPLHTEELTRIIEAVGAGLSYAHKAGILHRDIKPSNVLLAPDGGIYLADFGLARIAAAGESTLSGDMLMGTPQYISPEQAMGKKDLDEGTDIYSFGVMLYEMVVGQVPFNADTPFSIIHDHIYTPLPLPRAVNPNVPEAVERVLLKALAKERADRYATVNDLATAFVQAWLAAGLPMKGTDVTLSRKMMDIPEPEPLPKTDATILPESSATPEGAAPAPTVAPDAIPVAAPVKPKKKKFPRWIAIVAVVFILFCCLFLFLASRNNRGQNAERATPTVTAPAPQAVTPAVVDATRTPRLPLPRAILLDDFEGAPPPDSTGWEGYFDETTETKVTCAVTSDQAHGGANSLLFQFDVVADSWATCGFYFPAAQNWSNTTGVSFYMRADRAGMPFHVDMYAGAPGALITNYYSGETSPESVENWTLIELRWEDFLRAEWLENPGEPFNPVEVAGFSIGLSTGGMERTAGMIWLDDLNLVGGAAPGPEGAIPTPNAAILEARRAAEQNPTDPRAQLVLSLAYWDNGQTRLAYESLTRAANLAEPSDRAFFEEAAVQYYQREAWPAVSAMYIRIIRTLPAGPIPPEVEEPFHEAVYKASSTSELQLLFSVERISDPDQGRDQPMAFIAQGRAALYNGDLALANEYLEQVKSLKPSMPEIILLEAEIRYKEGKRDEAKRLLKLLIPDENVPAWIRRMAQEYFDQYQ
jgi:serine/threonine protein kinase